MRRTARNRIIAGALAIAATTAPTASARPNLQPATAQGQGTTEASAARSNHDHQPTPAAHVQVAAKEASTLEAMNRAKARDLAVRSYPPQAGGTYAQHEHEALRHRGSSTCGRRPHDHLAGPRV